MTKDTRAQVSYRANCSTYLDRELYLNGIETGPLWVYLVGQGDIGVVYPCEGGTPHAPDLPWCRERSYILYTQNVPPGFYTAANKLAATATSYAADPPVYAESDLSLCF